MFEIRSLKRSELIVETVKGGENTYERIQRYGKAYSESVTVDMRTQKGFGYLSYKVLDS